MSDSDRPRLLPRSWAIVVLTILLVGCAKEDAGDGVREGGLREADDGLDSGSCALVVMFRGERYVGRQVLVEPPVGAGLGEAVIPSCDDTSGGGSAADERIPVTELAGVAPRTAIVWEGSPSSILVREDIHELPAGLQQYFERPVCDPADAPISLFGTWVGIVGPNETTELDLLPPYDLELLVSVASAPRYEGADLTVRVPPSAGPLVTKRDIRTSLWTGGSIDMTVGCSGDRFVAEEVRTYPG